MYVVGADIGYSHLKVAHGYSGSARPRLRVISAISAPERSIAKQFTRKKGEEINGNGEGDRVWVRGEVWRVGVDSAYVQHRGPRVLHERYIDSRQWLALLHAALSYGSAPVVDRLVVGLPVEHFHTPGRSDALRAKLVGRHQITEEREVEVREVEVLPQPGGALADYAARLGDPLVWEGRVLVVDPGYYSFDWAVFERGHYLNQLSGSGPEAVSRIAEGVAASIAQTHKSAVVAADRVEESLYSGREYVFVGAAKESLGPHLKLVADEVVGAAMNRLLSAIRGEATSPNVVLVVGGGARFYQSAIESEFGARARVDVAPEPILANVRGFWVRGCDFA